MAQRLEALHDLPEGTLGHAYIEFYRRNNITLPGADVHTPAHYVSHDMNHVISGYEPTGPGEIALGAFTLAMNDNDANWIQFIANLAIHEAGLVQHGAIMPKDSTLTRPGATDLLGEALWRGAQCTADFSQADHLVMADWTLDDVRAHFGVPAADPSRVVTRVNEVQKVARWNASVTDRNLLEPVNRGTTAIIFGGTVPRPRFDSRQTSKRRNRTAKSQPAAIPPNPAMFVRKSSASKSLPRPSMYARCSSSDATPFASVSPTST